MGKRIYQPDPGRDDDWIAEGELEENDLRELVAHSKARTLQFQAVSKFPERPFRSLSALRGLKFLQFRACPLAPVDFTDLAALDKLESLWMERCPATDDGVAALAHHPKLWRVALNETLITDAALAHLATIPKLEWLWVDGTAITDRGVAHLATVTGLKNLGLRNTQVTDDGILQLATLPKLNLTLGVVQGTAVTEAGLNALFAARKELQKTAKAQQKSTQKPAVQLEQAEIDAAMDVLLSFFKAMNVWETSCYARNCAVENRGALDEDLWETFRAECRAIFAQYCTPKKRAYGRPENISIGNVPGYEADPAQEPITAIEAPTRQRIVIETQQKFGVGYRCQYVLLKKDGKWLIDSKKVWGAGWEWTIL